MDANGSQKQHLKIRYFPIKTVNSRKPPLSASTPQLWAPRQTFSGQKKLQKTHKNQTKNKRVKKPNRTGKRHVELPIFVFVKSYILRKTSAF